MHKLKNSLFSFLEKVLPYTFYQYIRVQYARITTKDKSKLYQSAYFYKFRPFSKKKYCIIRYPIPNYGFFGAARQSIFAVEYAQSKGMQPLIDIEWIDDFTKGILGKENRWEFTFTQEKIQDILIENATILVSELCALDMFLEDTCLDINNNPTDTYIHVTDNNWRDYYRNVYKYAGKYWIFDNDFLFSMNEKITELFGGKQNVLGVSLRELFSEEYNSQIEEKGIKKVLEQHPLGPNVSEILDIVAQHMLKWNCEKIFVATMYEDSIRMFEDRFPGRVIYMDRIRVTCEEDMVRINSTKSGEERSGGVGLMYEVEKGYIQEIFLLSKCTYLIGARSGGTIAALVLNNGQYKDIKILEDKRNTNKY